MPIKDISVTLSKGLPAFPGDPAIRLDPAGDAGSPFQLTRLQLGSHAGTHLDAPAHLLKDGATADSIPLATLIGPCRVIDLCDRTQPISAADLSRRDLAGITRLLLRTSNSELWQRPGFEKGYLGLTPAAAAHLVKLGIRLVGIDYLSIEPFSADGDVHRILLEAGVVILEGLDLAGVASGDYELICLPLKLAGTDGAPCRAVLRPLPA
ncbi:cyclase family protein [Trichloromonas sp.]|uniref:cyclase family protein n=1 Tax=Trichloromonas sp. TaxID=3069249 RepID=UPI003D81B048